MKRQAWMLLTLVAVFACSDEDEGDGGSSTAGSGAAGASGSASGGSAASAAGGAGDGGSAGDASGGSGGATGGSASGGNAAGGAGSGGASACPPEAGDTACVGCIKEDCCAELLACAQDPICACWRDCMKMPSDAVKCLEMCGDPSAATVAYGECGADSCQAVCPQFQ